MKWLEKYFKAIGLGLQSAMEYRVNFIMSILSSIFPMIIQIFLWIAVFKNSQSSVVYGYNYMQMLTYVVVAGIVSKLVATGVEWEISSDIKDEGLNKFITRPISYFSYRISCFLGEKFLQIIIINIILGIILIVMNIKLGLEIELKRVGIFLISIFLALILNLLLSLIISSFAFWITEAWAAFMILGLVVNVASGGVFPLDIFGQQVMRILELLPFKYIIYFPTNIINGKISFTEVGFGIYVQCIWIIFLFIFSKIIWNIGMKKYIAIGG
ncbi:ABC transporter permease [Clostridium beijerinckii]|uniref:ABC transporter permease n=1 Tax=Clostridium beijerinckii TaxID=1520 RepID=UPI0014946C42|nr:ABC-2 family transporter protein [Clostridium beijerinckii]NOW06645.1 ABC-2 type transport system permease protein [Clostridium beijerinckii]NYC00211.1 ABC-2 type transport system permease protein [Clostridium beijerinckii]